MAKRIGWGRSPQGHGVPEIPELPTPTGVSDFSLLLHDSGEIIVFDKALSINSDLIIKGVLMPLMYEDDGPNPLEKIYVPVNARSIQRIGSSLYASPFYSTYTGRQSIARFAWADLKYIPIWWLEEEMEENNPPWIVSNNAGIMKAVDSLYAVYGTKTITELQGEQEWDPEDYYNIADHEYTKSGASFLDSLDGKLQFGAGNKVYELTTIEYHEDAAAADFEEIDLPENVELSEHEYPAEESESSVFALVNKNVFLTSWGEGMLAGRESGDYFMFNRYVNYPGPATPGATPLCDITFGDAGNKPKFNGALLETKSEYLHYNVRFPTNSVAIRAQEYGHIFKRESRHGSLESTTPVECEEKHLQLINHFENVVAQEWGDDEGPWSSYSAPWFLEVYNGGGGCSWTEGWPGGWWDSAWYRQHRWAWRIKTSSLTSLIFPVLEEFLLSGISVRSISGYWGGGELGYELSTFGTLSVFGKDFEYSFTHPSDEPQHSDPAATHRRWWYRKLFNLIVDEPYTAEKNWNDIGLTTGCYSNYPPYTGVISRLGNSGGSGYGTSISNKMLEVIRQDWNEVKYVSDNVQRITLVGGKYIDVSD